MSTSGADGGLDVGMHPSAREGSPIRAAANRAKAAVAGVRGDRRAKHRRASAPARASARPHGHAVDRACACRASDQPGANGVGHGVRARASAELGDDVVQHVLHRALAVASSSATSRVAWPSAISRSTCSSRLVSCEECGCPSPARTATRRPLSSVRGQYAGALQGRADARLEAFRRQRVFTQDAAPHRPPSWPGCPSAASLRHSRSAWPGSAPRGRCG